MTNLIETLHKKRLAAYSEEPGDINEHFGIEQTVLAGGYGYRQVLELVQNGADAILEFNASGNSAGLEERIEVVLNNRFLYVANTGSAISEEGVDSLLRSHSSPKRGNQIGRFGLGFKSVLRLGGKIDLFSASIAFRFDPDRCRQKLKKKFNVENAPGMRLAWSLNYSDHKKLDPLLESLSKWATTVVRAELKDENVLTHLQDEIRSFPSAFLLFLPTSVTVILSEGRDQSRVLRRESDGTGRILLKEGETEKLWRIVEETVAISDEKAKLDATHIHARDEVPIAWAIPLDGQREQAGRFWAFFPTQTPTYVPGILNAPWKLNSDRNAIIGGEWNTALMQEAARLIATTLPTLKTKEDPGHPLDLFPRLPPRKDETAIPLVEALWSYLEVIAIVPDATGELHPAAELQRHPNVDAELVKQWSEIAPAESQKSFVHSSCLEGDRLSRLNVLASRLEARNQNEFGNGPPLLRLRECKVEFWFKAVASAEPSRAIEVLKLAETYAKRTLSFIWDPQRQTLAIIPNNKGKLSTTDELVIAPADAQVVGRSPVAPELVAHPDAERLLTEVMKVDVLNEETWRNLLVESVEQLNRNSHLLRTNEYEWKTFWLKLREAPQNVRTKFVQLYKTWIRVRRNDGCWVVNQEVLEPGRLVAQDDAIPSNQKVLLNRAAHMNDEAILQIIGIKDLPNEIVLQCKFEELLYEHSGVKHVINEWLEVCRLEYKERGDKRATSTHLWPVFFNMPNGWMLLCQIEGLANAKLTAILLKKATWPEFINDVKFGHRTVVKYPLIQVAHPLKSVLLKHGRVQIGNAAIELLVVVAYRNSTALHRIANWQELERGIQALSSTSIKPTKIQSHAFWKALIDLFATPSLLGTEELGDLWFGAARDGVVPTSLKNTSREFPLSEVYVTESTDLARRIRSPDCLVVTLDESTIKLWEKAGARNLRELLKPVFEKLGTPNLLTSIIPEFASVLVESFKVSARSQTVSDLSLNFNGVSERLPCLLWDDVVLVDTLQLSAFSRFERLNSLVREVAAAGWLKTDVDAVLKILCDTGVEQRRATVASGTTLSERLLLAVGNRVEPLLQTLGVISRIPDIEACMPVEIADLVLALIGTATLSTLRGALKEEGLKPPKRWNSAEARDFVASIGFPVGFAASSMASRDSEELISGPIQLRPLRDHQKEVMDGLRKLIRSGDRRRRAVVCLPTGGGKTRVVTQAAVELILKPEVGNRRVLWIAQTDELCEQAVQAFRQVWINLGTEGALLRIIRLWGGNPNPAPPAEGAAVVVVASIQTLNFRVGNDDLVWMRDLGMLIIDECHHALTKSYSNLLRSLDGKNQTSGVTKTVEPPIIGLSATPFRGTDEEESLRLAKRFDQRWLPADQEGLYERLRKEGVLAQAIDEPLQSPVSLLDEEINRLMLLGDASEGIDVENILEQINQRLAGDEFRNKILLNCIEQSSESSILFFANSVDHAKEMAARLHLRGIRSVAISAETAPTARRDFIKRFQHGEIRVLCNHSVLTTGFDAPKCDMVLISRQVFSSVRYMQMVGRGLRGEEYGGTARCRIVTVLDNLGRFAHRHPYHFCAKFFSSTSGITSKLK
jgi:superfamily II DNA or RNA helicase